MNTIAKKQDFEAKFTKWVEADNSRKIKYGSLLPAYKDLYATLKDYTLVNSYSNEVFSGAEAVSLARGTRNLLELTEKNSPEEDIKNAKENLIASSKEFFKDYNQATDKKLFIAVMKMYGENIDSKWLVPEYVAFKNKYKGDFALAADKLYEKSVFTDEAKYVAFITGFNKSSIAKVKKDQFYILGTGASDFIANTCKGRADAD